MKRNPQWLFNVQLGRELRDASIQQVEEHANPEWKVDAYAALLAVAKERETLTADDVWEVLATTSSAETHENRAMGPIMQSGRRSGLIENTGRTVPCRRPSRHVAPVTLWRSLLYREPS